MCKYSLRLLFCALFMIFISGCELIGTEVSSPVIFDEVGLPDNAPGIYTLTLEDSNEKKTYELALRITKLNNKYSIFMALDDETIAGDFLPSRVPGSEDLYVLSVENEKRYIYNKKDAQLRGGRIKAHSLILVKLNDDGVAFPDWIYQKNLRYEGKKTDVTYRAHDQKIVYMYDAEGVKRHLIKHQAAIREAVSDRLLFKRPGGLFSRFINWLKYHKIVTLGNLQLYLRGVRGEHYLNIEKKEKEYLEYAEMALKERSIIDEEIDRRLVSYLKNDDAYIIPVTEEMEKICKSSNIGRENQPYCYKYVKALEAKKKKIKQDGYIKNLIKIGSPQLEQGSTARAYTYRTPDRTEIAGRNIYTYPGETVTSYTSDVDRYAFLHIPVVNDSCSVVTVDATALFIYNPFNPNDNQGAVANFFGDIYKAIVSSVDSSFGKRRASGRMSLEPSSVGTLTIELDSSGFFSNGIRMREAKIEELTYDMKNPGCIEKEAAGFAMASRKVQVALMNPWWAAFPKSFTEQREGSAK